MKREMGFAQAINEAFYQLLEADKNVMLIGQGVTSPWYVGATTIGLVEQFGEKRVIDTPVSESGIMGAVAGASLVGVRPIIVFPRMDFMYYAFDQIANHIAPWHFMFGGKRGMPLVIWAIINRGGEQAAQHSQAIQAMFAHMPGLKVVMPSTPYDAKGLLISAVLDDNPVIYIDDRWLYQDKGHVPQEMYTVDIGKAVVRKKGKDITIVASSYVCKQASDAAKVLLGEKIDLEVIDLLTIKPLDVTSICNSVKKTGRLIVVDGGWRTCGVASEIIALVNEKVFPYLKHSPVRITLPDVPAPASCELEKAYYPNVKDIIHAVKKLINCRGGSPYPPMIRHSRPKQKI